MAAPRDKPTSAPVYGSLTLLGLAGITLALGYWRMFSHFPGYDDEGYIMLTVRDYVAGGGLYEVVYSQYGPGFYVLMDLLVGGFGLDLTHAGARWFSLALWFGAAVGCAELVRYFSRSIGWATGAGVASFMFLYQFSEEAFHPGVVVVLLLPWLLRLLAARATSERDWGLAVGAGVATAFLTLLKINVGVLFGVGFVVWYILLGRARIPGGRWGAPLLIGVAAVTGLLAGAWSEGWVVTFWFLILAGLIGIVAVTDGERAGDWREVGVGVASGLSFTVLVVGVVLMRGTSFPALLEGVWWGPLRHADSYSYAVDWRSGTWLNALVALAGLMVYLRWRRGERAAAAQGVLASARLVLLAGTGLAVVGLDQWRVFGALFSFIAPWIWVWIPPLDSAVDRRKAHEVGRPLVGLVLLFQLLHAYPVGGIQICWGSFLWLSMVALAGPETLRYLCALRPTHRRAVRWVGIGLGCLVVGKLLVMSWDHRREYHALTPVNLPGSGSLRLPAPQTAAIRTLTINSILHGDVLFSLPGMFSYNLWSELPTPNQRNTTLWYRLLDEADQTRIIADLDAAVNPVIIVDWLSLQIGAAHDMAVSGPLYDHIMAEFQPAFMANQYGFMVRKGRVIAPFGTAWATPGRIQVCLLGSEAGVSSIQFLDTSGDAANLPRLTAANSRVVVQRVDRAGRPQGEAITEWPLQWQGLAWLTIEDTNAPADWSLISFSHADQSAPTVVVRSGQ